MTCTLILADGPRQTGAGMAETLDPVIGYILRPSPQEPFPWPEICPLREGEWFAR